MKLLEEEELSENSREFLGKIRDQMEKNDFLMQSMVKMSRLEAGILQIRKENKKFYEQSGGELSQAASGRYYMDFKQKAYDEKRAGCFYRKYELGKQQTLFFTADLGVSVQILTGLAGLITLTVGMGVTYFLYESMNFREIGFAVPLLPLLLAALLSLLVCTLVPVFTWMVLEKNGSIVERIKGVE